MKRKLLALGLVFALALTACAPSVSAPAEDNTPAVSQDAQTLSLEGGLDLVFSLAPDNFNVKVTDVATGEVKFKGMVRPHTKLLEYGIDFKRVMRGRLVLGIADGWVKADGETIYQATDLRVGLSKEKAA